MPPSPANREVFVDLERGFGIAAAPKVGTLSIVRFLFQLRHSREPKAGEATHKWSGAAGLRMTCKAAFDSGLPVIAVHRDPYERIRSCYQHRVLREREAPARSFRDFCERLADYRKVPSIAWHTDPQSLWLGDREECFASCLGLNDLHILPAVLRHLTGRNYPEMPWEHRMAAKPPWEDGLMELLAPWVAADLDAGWTGITSPALLGMAAEIPRPAPRLQKHARAMTSEPQKIPLGKYRDYKKWGWYRLLPGVWLRWVASPHPVRALEIGAFDGVSANVMLDSIFTHPDSTVDTIDPYLADPTTPQVGPHTRALFEENTRRGCHGGRVRLHVGKSLEVLTRMIADGAVESFDVVFIDGSHLGADVLTDAVLSWPLLKPGGILIFDDYDWGGGISPHRRPKEAIQAFEAAFVESLVPLYRGTQRIYRKVGVPGGLRNERGEALSQTCAIIGTYDSGSSLLSSIMECFGYNIARPTREDFFESASLREILVRAIDEPGMVMRMASDQLVAELAEWRSRFGKEAPALCVKHPLLGLCLPELKRAWGQETVIIHARRPLEKSIRGLVRRGWFPQPERMQRAIHTCIEDWIMGGNSCISVDYEELLAAPEFTISKLAKDLGIGVPDQVISRAVAMVERRGC